MLRFEPRNMQTNTYIHRDTLGKKWAECGFINQTKADRECDYFFGPFAHSQLPANHSWQTKERKANYEWEKNMARNAELQICSITNASLACPIRAERERERVVQVAQVAPVATHAKRFELQVTKQNCLLLLLRSLCLSFSLFQFFSSSSTLFLLIFPGLFSHCNSFTFCHQC